MEKAKIERINALARKQREGGLTPEEKKEQSALRAEYLSDFRRYFSAQLDNVYIEREDGSYEKLRKKGEPPKGGHFDA